MSIKIEMTHRELKKFMHQDGYSDGLFLDESNQEKIEEKLYRLLRTNKGGFISYCDGFSKGLHHRGEA